MNKTFHKLVFLFLFLLFIYSCDESAKSPSDNYRLTSKPGIPTQNFKVGVNSVDLGDFRNCYLFVPSSYSNDKLTPLLVALHGAGGNAVDWLEFFEIAETRGMIMLTIDSYSTTWDFIYGNYGTDVEFLDKALNYTFERCNVDPEHIALGGFSDGASYALSLGLLNGNLFSHIIAFSPGFVDQTYLFIGNPKIYITHGKADKILPVSKSRDIIVPNLEYEGYDVTYFEHDGGHEITSAIFNFSIDWFLK
jgi:phospholipase/carboxylesterase